jgi:hypothetical protein
MFPKGGLMRRFIWIGGAILLLFSVSSSLSQSKFAEELITDEEYAIFRLALEEVGGTASIDKETLDDVLVEDDALRLSTGIRPDADMVHNFKAQNLKKHPISTSFLQEMTQVAGFGREERKKVSFSRVGFDKPKRHAMLLVGSTFYYPEDIMNEGMYLFLEKKAGKWTVGKKATAWSMRLGKIR